MFLGTVAGNIGIYGPLELIKSPLKLGSIHGTWRLMAVR